MVVLSACICTKAGKILLARQFVEMSRLKVEEHIASFPKLLAQGEQYTHVETDSARYVYIPIESLYMVLITNRNSNIIEDLEVVRQMQMVVQHLCPLGVQDKSVHKKCFEIILAFDDIISQGYREQVTMNQIESFLEMDSTDEKMHKKMQLIREAEAKDNAKKHQIEMERRKLDPNHQQDKTKSISSSDYKREDEVKTTTQRQSDIIPTMTTTAQKKAPGKGLQLGGKNKKSELIKKLEIIKPVQEEVKQEVNALTENVLVEIDESVSCLVNKDGDIQKCELKGIVWTTFTDPSKLNSIVGFNLNDAPKGLTYKPNPDVNKQEWQKNKSIVSSGDGFSQNTKLDAIRYRYVISSEDKLPFTVSVWNSKGSCKQHKIALEVEFNGEQNTFKYFKTLKIKFNVNDEPIIISNQNSLSDFYPNEQVLEWKSELINSEESSSMIQFETDTNLSSLFPISLTFDEDYTLLDLQIAYAKNLDTEESISVNFQKRLQTESYKISLD